MRPATFHTTAACNFTPHHGKTNVIASTEPTRPYTPPSAPPDTTTTDQLTLTPPHLSPPPVRQRRRARQTRRVSTWSPVASPTRASSAPSWPRPRPQDTTPSTAWTTVSLQVHRVQHVPKILLILQIYSTALPAPSASPALKYHGDTGPVIQNKFCAEPRGAHNPRCRLPSTEPTRPTPRRTSRPRPIPPPTQAYPALPFPLLSSDRCAVPGQLGGHQCPFRMRGHRGLLRHHLGHPDRPVLLGGRRERWHPLARRWLLPRERCRKAMHGSGRMHYFGDRVPSGRRSFHQPQV